MFPNGNAPFWKEHSPYRALPVTLFCFIFSSFLSFFCFSLYSVLCLSFNVELEGRKTLICWTTDFAPRSNDLMFGISHLMANLNPWQLSSRISPHVNILFNNSLRLQYVYRGAYLTRRYLAHGVSCRQTIHDREAVCLFSTTVSVSTCPFLSLHTGRTSAFKTNLNPW